MKTRDATRSSSSVSYRPVAHRNIHSFTHRFYFKLMTLACISASPVAPLFSPSTRTDGFPNFLALVIPAAYHSAQSRPGGIDDGQLHIMPWIRLNQVVDGSDLDDKSNHGLRVISRGTAILLLFVYLAYLIFQLKTHRYLYLSSAERYREDCEEARLLGKPLPVRPANYSDEVETPEMNRVAAGLGLIAATVVTSFCADYLVASIEETATRYSIPRAFIGLILLPIVANAAEHVTSVWMAMKDKMELTITICVGSSIVRISAPSFAP